MAQTPPRRPRPPRRARRAARVFAAFTFLLLGLAGAFLGYTYRHSAFLPKYMPALIGGLWPLHPRTPADVFPGPQGQALNLLIVGRDYDYTDQDQIIKSHARSDVLMVARVDFAGGKVSLLSIPRDTRAEIPGHGLRKINAAHQYGGPALTAQTVQANFGIPTDKYVALDFDGFEQAIDQLGGVDLVVDKKMDYDDNWGHLHIHLKPGYQHLNGQQAMGFVRFRHSDSDLVRVQRQQALLAALKARLRDPGTLAKLPAVLDTIDRHVDSDLTPEQKVILARFVHDTPHDRIQMTTLPSDERGAMVATDWPRAAPVIQSLFGVTPPETVASAGGRRHRRHRRHPLRLAQAR